MIELDVSILIQLVNFLIMITVLRVILVQPIRKQVAERKALMRGMVSEAEKFNDAADAKLSNYEKELLAARQAATVEREKVRALALEEEKKILESAGSEASESIAGARAEIQGQVKSAMDALKGQVDALAQKASEKVLG